MALDPPGKKIIHGEAQRRSAASLRDGGGSDPLRGRGFSRQHTLGAYMQVGDERFDSDDIHRLYQSSDYPLRRAG